jgi:WD40 repeat protein
MRFTVIAAAVALLFFPSIPRFCWSEKARVRKPMPEERADDPCEAPCQQGSPDLPAPRAGKPLGADYVRAALGPIDNVYGLAFSPDGRFLLSGGDQGHENEQFVVNLWDVVAKERVTTFKTGNKRQILKIAYSPSGSSFAVGDYDGEVHILSREGKHLNSFRHFERLPSTIIHIRFIDDVSVFSVSQHHLAQISNIKTNRTLNYLVDAAPGFVSGADTTCSLGFFAWCDNYSLTMDRDKMRAGHAYIRFKEQIPIYGCAISADGTMVMATSEKGRLCLFDIARKKLIKTWQGHRPTLNIYAVARLPKRKAFVTVDAAGNLKFWNHAGELLAHVRYFSSATAALAVSEDGKLLATSGEAQRILLWDLNGILRAKKK